MKSLFIQQAHLGGYCFTYNGNQVEENLKTNYAEFNSINILLNIGASNRNGVYIYVHDPLEMQNWVSGRYTGLLFVTGGTKANIAVKKKVHTSLKPPHSSRDCLDQSDKLPEEPSLKTAMDFFRFPYSENLCLQDCLLDKLLFRGECSFYTNNNGGCTYREYSVARGQNMTHNPSACAYCMPNCTRTTYETMIHQEENTVKQHMAKISLSYSTMEVTQSRQVQAMTFTTLYSNIGGVFGFFAGASIISFLQLLDFFIRWVATKITKFVISEQQKD